MTKPVTLVAMTADAFSEQVLRISRENSELRARVEVAEARVKELEAQLDRTTGVVQQSPSTVD